MKVKKRTKVWGGVSSMTFTQDYTHFFAGTDEVISPSLPPLIPHLVQYLLGQQ